MRKIWIEQGGLLRDHRPTQTPLPPWPPGALASVGTTEALDGFNQVWGAARGHLPIASDLAAELERLLGVVPLARNKER